MQINKLLFIIHKLVKIVYQKTAYEDTYESLFVCITKFIDFCITYELIS